MELFRNACRKYGIAPALHHPHSLDDMDALADAAPPALICDAPYCLKHFCSAIRGRQDYHPHIIGIYDEWNWLERPDSLCGAILLQSEKQIRLAVHELIGQIENFVATLKDPYCKALAETRGLMMQLRRQSEVER